MKERPTIIDVAKHAGVSKTTVSRVIGGDGARVREATRKHVEAVIARLGYEHNAVASSLRTARTNIVMLAIPDITNPFWPDVARGAQDVLDGAGYAVVFANSDWDGRREVAFLQTARRGRFDGMLINPIQLTNDQLRSAGLPAVVIGSDEDFPDFDTVGSDSYGAMGLALDHLLSLGHQRIGLIRGERRSRPGHSRLAAYLDFLREKGIPVDEQCIVVAPFTLAGGNLGMQQLLDLSQPPSAVLAANDILAIGALQAAHERGLEVPRDLSIAGIDDIFAASTTTPSLTTVAKPKYQIGQQAARLLLERIQRQAPAEPRRHIFPCALQRRGSTMSPAS